MSSTVVGTFSEMCMNISHEKKNERGRMSYFSSACLRISGDDVNPELCSALLQIEPDRAWAKGEIYHLKIDGREAIRNTGLWLYASKLAIPPYNPDLHVREIISVFKGKGKVFDEIRRQGDVRFSLIVESFILSLLRLLFSYGGKFCCLECLFLAEFVW